MLKAALDLLGKVAISSSVANASKNGMVSIAIRIGHNTPYLSLKVCDMLAIGRKRAIMAINSNRVRESSRRSTNIVISAEALLRPSLSFK